jgi:hypothetical protein
MSQHAHQRLDELGVIFRWLCIISALGCCVGCYFPDVSLNESEQTQVKASLFPDRDSVKPQKMVGAVIEDQVRLIGYDINKSRARPGDTVVVTYYLEGLTDEPIDSEIFVHLQGSKSGAWQNLDHTPVKGLFPLRKLRKGQVLKDVQRFKIKRRYPAGKARLFWGLFQGKRRLKILNPIEVKHDRKNRVFLGDFTVMSPRPPVKVVAYQLAPHDKLVIDGKLDEPSWRYAKWTRRWGDPLGRRRDRRGKFIKSPGTRAKFVWGPQDLYIAIEASDRDIWATFTERDSNTWEQEVVEVFLDPDGDERDYLELQVTPANVVFDAQFAYHRSDLKRARAWNFKGWETAVHVKGTLNQRDDRDTSYIVEMRLPISELPGAPKVLSATAKPWRLNLFRFDWDEAPKGRQKAAALSPPYVGDFHLLSAFAQLQFKPSLAPASPAAPRSDSTPSAHKLGVTTPSQSQVNSHVTQQKRSLTDKPAATQDVPQRD